MRAFQRSPKDRRISDERILRQYDNKCVEIFLRVKLLYSYCKFRKRRGKLEIYLTIQTVNTYERRYKRQANQGNRVSSLFLFLSFSLLSLFHRKGTEL